MADRLEAGDGLTANALGGAVGRDQLGISGLELLQLFQELVEFPVGDFRLGIYVVSVVVMIDEAAQFLDAVFDVEHGFSARLTRSSGADTLVRRPDRSVRPTGFKRVVDRGRTLHPLEELWPRRVPFSSAGSDRGPCSKGRRGSLPPLRRAPRCRRSSPGPCSGRRPPTVRPVQWLFSQAQAPRHSPGRSARRPSWRAAAGNRTG